MRDTWTRRGGLARAKKLSPVRRHEIAREAAHARWRKQTSGILSLAQIKSMVENALLAHLGSTDEVAAFLFGSYARREAGPNSDLDILVVAKKLPENWARETSLIREHLTFNKDVDLVLIDEQDFHHWKDHPGTVPYDAVHEGIRLV
jgi:predicted nucleotidyltransferase